MRLNKSTLCKSEPQKEQDALYVVEADVLAAVMQFGTETSREKGMELRESLSSASADVEAVAQAVSQYRKQAEHTHVLSNQLRDAAAELDSALSSENTTEKLASALGKARDAIDSMDFILR